MYRFKVKGEVIRDLGDSFIVNNREYNLFRVKVGDIKIKALVWNAVLPIDELKYFECSKAVLTKQSMVEGGEEVVIRMDTLRSIAESEFKEQDHAYVKLNGLVREFGPLRKTTEEFRGEKDVCTFKLSIRDTLSHDLYTIHAVAFGNIARQLAEMDPEVFMNVYGQIQVSSRHGVEVNVTGFKRTGKYVA